jgi:hypothetical protein
MTDDQKLEPNVSVITASEFIAKSLEVPPYQRPYRWTEVSVRMLLDDVYEEAYSNFKKGKKLDDCHYWLGTVVLHRGKDDNGADKLDIVDGLQRYVTLYIFKEVAYWDENSEKTKGTGTDRFYSVGSKRNIENTVLTINNWFKERGWFGQKKSESGGVTKNFYRNYLLDHCVMGCIEVNSVKDAFQVFSTQNTRGKPLENHDLLKAFHLGKMKDHGCVDSDLKKHANLWQKVETGLLKDRFKAIFCSKAWSAGRKVGFTTFDNVEVERDYFKGLDLGSENVSCSDMKRESAPVNYLYRILRGNSVMLTEDGKTSFPFQLDQPVLNGRLFFEMIEHYSTYLPESVFKHSINKSDFKEYKDCAKVWVFYETMINASRIKKVGCNYGNWYSRLLFNFAVMSYRDRFGDERLLDALKIIYPWSFKTRITHDYLTFKTIENVAAVNYPDDSWRKDSALEGKSPYGLLRLIAVSPSPSAFFNSVDRLLLSQIKINDYPNAGENWINVLRKKCESLNVCLSGEYNSFEIIEGY